MRSSRIAGASTPLEAVLVSAAAAFLVGLLLWLVGLVLTPSTDGVPLFSPGAPLAADVPLLQSLEAKQSGFVRYRPVVLTQPHSAQAT
jgi:hypothetical protein